MEDSLGLSHIKDTLGLSFPMPVKVLSVMFWSTQTSPDNKARLMLTLSPQARPEARIEIIFFGVRSLSIPHIGPGGIECPQLQITDMSDAQWENIRWSVDDKGETISFYAAKLETRSIDVL
jgi:hypothetical protein